MLGFGLASTSWKTLIGTSDFHCEPNLPERCLNPLRHFYLSGDQGGGKRREGIMT
jgi:hypothetical protein